MKTKIYLLVVLFVLAVSVNAQTKDEKTFKIGAGAMVGLPMGDFTSGVKNSDVFKLTYGFDLTGEYPIAPTFALTLSAGYVDWAWKSDIKAAVEDEMGMNVSFAMIPVLAGAKYYFTDKLYGSAQIGLSFFTMKDAGNAFTFAPGIGFKVSEKFDLLLKYQSLSKEDVHLSFLGLRAGLAF